MQTITTNKNNIQHKLAFYNCFFKKIDNVTLQSSTAEDAQVTFGLTLGYTYFDFL